MRAAMGSVALGGTEPAETLALRAHLDGCAECRAELRELTSVAAALPFADPARDAGNSELRRELCTALADVSPEQAQVVLLKDALGYSFEEIAEAAGMPVGTAKCHAHRGRSRMRERHDDVA